MEKEFANINITGPGPNGDAAVYYSLIREFQPSIIIEVGSGVSLIVALRASIQNNDSTEMIAVKPYPDDTLLDYDNSYKNIV